MCEFQIIWEEISDRLGESLEEIQVKKKTKGRKYGKG
jgi:hypothetical protein